mgnify:CR=1 FL=1
MQQTAIEQHALQQVAAFASRLLEEASGPELEARLLTLLLAGLSELSETQFSSLRQQWGEPPDSIEVSSAFTLGAEQRQQIERGLRRVSGLVLPVHFTEDSELMAGFRIAIGAWVLAANVRDELVGFAEFADAPR